MILRVSNYSLYHVALYEQVSGDPTDDTGRVTLIDPLNPVSQTDLTLTSTTEALIRVRLRANGNVDNYINTWIRVSGDSRLDISNSGSSALVPEAPYITTTTSDPVTFGQATVMGFNENTASLAVLVTLLVVSAIYFAKSFLHD